MRRRLIIVAVSLIVVVIPAVIIIYAVNRSPQLQNTVLKVANVNRPSANVNPANANTITDPRASDRQAVTFTSRNFAERFGSESNQNNFANFVQAKAYGTTSFNASVERSIAQQRLTAKTTPYTGTITKALSISIGTLGKASTSVTVSTQRQETIDRTERVYYQDLILEMLKVGNDWKVNAASWKVS